MRTRLLVVSLVVNVLLVLLIAGRAVRARLQSYRSEKERRGGGEKLSPAALFSQYPEQEGSTIFLGDSLTAEAPLGELFANVLNRGVGGNTTADLLARIDEVTNRKPRRLVLLIGINDLLRGVPAAQLLQNVDSLLARIRRDVPEVELTLLSLLPVRKTEGRAIDNQTIKEVNGRLAALGAGHGARFVDAFPGMCDAEGQLRSEFTYDGLHLTPSGYWRLRSLLLPALGDTQVGAQDGP